ncbi:MAG TPA: PAS domain S-box protein [Bacteroidota bacterium]|nr:PAS domain S-box protein [Bacteroidota bacterium]
MIPLGTFSSSTPPSRHSGKIFKYTFIYAGISCLWILFSDKLVTLADPKDFEVISTAKGWLFVAVTATLLYAMLVRNANRIMMTEAAHTVLFNYAADSIVITDERGSLLDVNVNAEELLGYSRSELLRMGLHDIIAGDDLAKSPLETAELCPGKSLVIERRYVRKDRSLIPVEINATSLPENRHVAIVRDITQRKLMEEALLQSEQQNRAIINAVPDLLFRIGSDGTLLEYRASNESQLYLPPSEFLGKNISEVLPPNVSVPALEALQKTLRNGTIESFEYSLSVGGSTRFFEDRIVGLSETEVLSVIRDITDRKVAEKERQELQEQLLRAQKIESLGTLAAGIAHDFNNILNIIMGNATLLAKEDENPEKLKRRIQAIADATDRGSRLVNQLLAFARKTDIKQQTVSLNDFIRDTSKLLEETFPKTVSLAFELEPNLPPVIADPNQLHQVLLNLSVNARDAMPDGGRLTFTTRYVPHEEIHERFPQATVQPYVAFTVLDNGMGMDEETRARIFDPFFTTKEIGKGTGLGLAVVLGIVQSHNGFVDVKSEPGAGSEFAVYLPAAQDRGERKSVAQSEEHWKKGNNELILFIEDEVLALEATTDFLLAGGYAVLPAPDAEQGLELFKAHQHEIVLVLSDYGLPKYSGAEVFSRMKQLRPDVRFILITGFLEQEIRDRLLEQGVRDIVTKPYKPMELLKKIRSVVEPTT